MKSKILILLQQFILLFLGLSHFASASMKDVKQGQGPNILLITVDDMTYDSFGFMGCNLKGITPNIDRLASQGVVFTHGHIVTPICGPSRHALHTGRYPHQTGYMGHGNQPPSYWEQREEKPAISTQLHEEGYFTGIFCKSAAHHSDKWDVKDMGMHGGRDADKYYKGTLDFIEKSQRKNQPFFLNANIRDPHRYWARTEEERNPNWWKNMIKNETIDKLYDNGLPWPDPESNYLPEEISVPLCYPDIPEIREHYAPYYNSCNRADQITGAILKALDESGCNKNTLVIFLSDHGAGWAFQKWSLYSYGTRTPIIFKYPEQIAPKTINSIVVSAVDIAPTIAQFAGLNPLNGIEGQSLYKKLKGQDGFKPREVAYTCFNHMNNLPERNYNGEYFPMRAVTSTKFVYIRNLWTDDQKELTESMGNKSKPIVFMEKYPGYQKRVDFFRKRVPEEFYDIENDPGCRKNLIDDPAFKEKVNYFRNLLMEEMEKTDDPELENI